MLKVTVDAFHERCWWWWWTRAAPGPRTGGSCSLPSQVDTEPIWFSVSAFVYREPGTLLFQPQARSHGAHPYGGHRQKNARSTSTLQAHDERTHPEYSCWGKWLRWARPWMFSSGPTHVHQVSTHSTALHSAAQRTLRDMRRRSGPPRRPRGTSRRSHTDTTRMRRALPIRPPGGEASTQHAKQGLRTRKGDKKGFSHRRRGAKF